MLIRKAVFFDFPLSDFDGWPGLNNGKARMSDAQQGRPLRSGPQSPSREHVYGLTIVSVNGLAL
ncbi:MAG: hypothetical protein IID45_00655 [Planctomycetes bacterium]|nr:hypothetical protein [Planctomycetota bacterium]